MVAASAPGPHTIVLDQSILDESSQMLEFLQKENAKVKDENARLHREVRSCILASFG